MSMSTPHYGPVPVRGRHRLVPIPGLGDNRDVTGGLKDHPQSRTHQSFVIDHQNPDHTGSSI